MNRTEKRETRSWIMAVMNSAGRINFDKREEYVFSDEATVRLTNEKRTLNSNCRIKSYKSPTHQQAQYHLT